jgi:hypothetical protein
VAMYAPRRCPAGPARSTHPRTVRRNGAWTHAKLFIVIWGGGLREKDQLCTWTYLPERMSPAKAGMDASLTAVCTHISLQKHSGHR